MPLTDAAIRKSKPAPKARKLSDGGGLFLLIAPTGGKLWRLKYRFGGKEKLLALGAYPHVTLAPASNATRRNGSSPKALTPASSRKPSSPSR